MYILLDEAKRHMNIDESFHDDDYYIASLIEVAEKVVEKNIDIKLVNLEDEDGDIPTPLIQAMLLLVGNFYANRESVAFANVVNVPLSYQYLIDLYRDYRGDEKSNCRKKYLACVLEQNKKRELETITDDVDSNTENNEDDNNG